MGDSGLTNTLICSYTTKEKDRSIGLGVAWKQRWNKLYGGELPAQPAFVSPKDVLGYAEPITLHKWESKTELLISVKSRLLAYNPVKQNHRLILANKLSSASDIAGCLLFKVKIVTEKPSEPQINGILLNMPRFDHVGVDFLWQTNEGAVYESSSGTQLAASPLTIRKYLTGLGSDALTMPTNPILSKVPLSVSCGGAFVEVSSVVFLDNYGILNILHPAALLSSTPSQTLCPDMRRLGALAVQLSTKRNKRSTQEPSILYPDSETPNRYSYFADKQNCELEMKIASTIWAIDSTSIYVIPRGKILENTAGTPKVFSFTKLKVGNIEKKIITAVECLVTSRGYPSCAIISGVYRTGSGGGIFYLMCRHSYKGHSPIIRKLKCVKIEDGSTSYLDNTVRSMSIIRLENDTQLVIGLSHQAFLDILLAHPRSILMPLATRYRLGPRVYPKMCVPLQNSLYIVAPQGLMTIDLPTLTL